MSRPIHVLSASKKEDVDARRKAGHDVERVRIAKGQRRDWQATMDDGEVVEAPWFRY